MIDNTITAIDLFCGCGGFSYGFKQAGINVILGIDMWKDATTTYKWNFIDAKVINDNIQKITGEIILQYLEIEAESIDIIIGGPPCQGFSVSGKRLKDDPRNSLYKSFVDIVSEIKPKMFVMENVPGLVRLFNGKVREEVIKDFSELGYEVKDQILVASDFGVPQIRKRVFFVGINRDKIHNTKEFIFPKPTHGSSIDQIPYITCKDAISDIDFVPVDISLGEDIEYQVEPQNEYQKLMRKNSNRLLNHSITVHTEKTRRIISMVPDGGNYKDLPDELQKTRKVNIAWTRMNSQRPCFTIDTGHNHHFHYKENRVPTVRESARIQSFPDSFKFKVLKQVN